MTLRLAADAAGIAGAAALLRAGKLVAFPTETVYGLGADATDSAATARIFAAKGRPAFNPLIAHVADVAAAEREGEFGPAARALAAAFWPGPLTLVVPARPEASVCELARAGLASVGLRVPSHPVAQALLRATGRPVAAPSANRSGHVSPTTAAHVLADLDGALEAVLDGDACAVGLESTIVGCDGARAVLLRPGGVTRAALAKVLGQAVEMADGGDHTAPQSPGRLLAHYAPATPMRWLGNSPIPPGAAVLAFGPAPLAGAERAGVVHNLSPSGNLVEAAATLYSSLRSLDAGGANVILVAEIPKAGIGEAICDRLTRAIAATSVV